MTTSKRILVIEADTFTQGWLNTLLGSEGFSVSTADNLSRGQELLSTGPEFTAIICNYCLPDGTCQDLLNVLRSRREPFVPVLLISGNWIQWIDSLRGTAGVEVLSKPFDAVQLIAALKRLLLPAPLEKPISRDYPLPTGASSSR